jgi:hypothetical protein
VAAAAGQAHAFYYVIPVSIGIGTLLASCPRACSGQVVAPTLAQSEFIVAQRGSALSEGHHRNQCPLSPNAIAEFWRGDAAGD